MELEIVKYLRNCMVDHTRELRVVTLAGEKMNQGVRYENSKKIIPKSLGFFGLNFSANIGLNQCHILFCYRSSIPKKEMENCIMGIFRGPQDPAMCSLDQEELL